MQRKETHRAPAEYQPSRKAIILFVALLFVAVGAFAYYCYQLVERQTVVPQSASVTPNITPEPEASRSVDARPEQQQLVASEPTTSAPAQFRCDGRTRCSQMTSCNEATFFLRNCPGTQMDGDNDGIPCEQQWCGN